LVLLGAVALGATRRASPTLTPAQLVRKTQTLIGSKGLQSIHWGVCIMRLDSGAVVFSHNADDLFIPASNRKMFVSALALHHLGPDYRFSTPLFLSAPVNDLGSVHGDLIVRGCGDPTFLNPRFNDGSMSSTLRHWARDLSEQKVRVIHGDIVMDSSGFDAATRTAAGWIKDYETAQYAPRPSGISIGGNCVAVTVKPASQPGARPIVQVHPPNSIVTVDNQARTGTRNAPDTIEILRGDDGPDHLVVRGQIASNAPQQAQRIPLEQPGLVAGDLFRSILADRGIMVRGEVRARNGDTPTSATPWLRVAVYESPPLADLLAVTNKDSDNFCAEQLFLAVAFAKTGRASYSSAKRFEEELLASMRILPDAANFEDGSGLSRLNLVTPRATCRMLRHMGRHDQADVFRESLAIAGRDGTLRKRMGPRALGRIYAKTGQLSMASCLSGYAKTRSGVMVAFSILANECEDRTGDACYVQDRICEWIVSTRF
jgi:PBP4 family serine-type D-alanyl-D-alanine carboxypeptidase